MKLDKVRFLNDSGCHELTKEEQKMILGGYDGKECCWWESLTNGEKDGGCLDAAGASFMGTYHWECNTSYASRKCGC